jgi:hypothetical protein
VSCERADQTIGEVWSERVVETRLNRRALLGQLDGDEQIADELVRNPAGFGRE